MEKKQNSRTKLLSAVIISAAAILLVVLALVLAMCTGPGEEPEQTTAQTTEPIATEEVTVPAPEVPVKVWDMEALPENLIAEGMAYAKSNDNIYGNLIMGAGPGKGLGGSQAFAYTFVGDYSEGDIFVMSPKSLKDPNFVSDWTNGEMLWVWVNGVELMQTVRLELVVNGLYTPFESVYYTVNEKGECEEVGTIPRAWGDKTTRGRIPITAGFSGWIGIPLTSFGNPELISSMQVHVGNSTIKAGNVLYLDEFWLTEMGQVPPLSLEQLSYDASESLTLGDIWNVEDLENGSEIATVGANETRGDVTSVVAEGKGVEKSNAVAYKIQDTTKTNTQNVDFNFPGLVRYGATIRGIKDKTNLIWFWVDSRLSSDQLLHIQLNGVFMDDNKSVYTIVSSNGTPKLQQVPYRSGKGMVNGMSVVPYDGNTGGKYARIELTAGWSGWIGIPVENFCVNSDGTAAQLPSGRAAKLTFRLFGTKDTLQKGDTLYFDEFWITEAGEMPELSNEALTYGYTPSYVRPSVTYGRIWNAEGGSNAAGKKLGTVETGDEWNSVSAAIIAGKGVSGSNAMNYSLTGIKYGNGANVLLETGELESLDFKTALVTKSTDILWLWVDSAVTHDQLLHLQVNGRLMGLNKSIYTIVEENGKPVMQEVPYTSDGAMISGGIGVVPSNGKVQSKDTTYARIKLCDGWSGWIGVPVENFNVQSGKTVNTAIKQINKYQIRNYVTNKDVLSKGDALYFDEFWLTKAGQMPGLSDGELLYGYTKYSEIEHIDYGCIWDADDALEDAAVGTPAVNDDQNPISSTVTAGKGVAGKNALGYQLLGIGNGNSNNVTLEVAELAEHGFKLANVTAGTDILWLWVDSAANHDQLLHLQVNGRLMGVGSSIYTIVGNDGTAVLQEIPYSYNGAEVTSGIGVVPSNGKEETESTTYVRIKLCDGWSGWIGVPVKHFNVQSNVAVDTVITRIDKLQIRSYVTNKDVLSVGELLYFDEFWLTKGGAMPALSSEELLYGYMEPQVETGSIWNVEHEDLTDGQLLDGLVGTDSGRSNAVAGVYEKLGVLGSDALGYRLTSVSKTQTNNMELISDRLGQYGCSSPAIEAGDMLWFWAYADLSADQLLHVQLNDVKVFLKWADIYTIGDENGAPVLQSVKWYGNRDDVPADALGVVYPNGTSGNYARILIRAGWSGWIGIPVENFAVDSSGNGASVPTGQLEKLVLRLYGTANSLKKGDILYYDEFWITDANTMPDLSEEALLYTYTDPVMEFEPAARYESGMIFQQGKPWQVHGTGIDGQTITVSLRKGAELVCSAQTQVADSAWSVTMAAVNGSYDTYTLEVSNGTQVYKLTDILFGEVWIAGGQSNMAYTVEQITTAEQQTALRTRLNENEHSSYIRFYTQSGENSKLQAVSDPVGYWANAAVWEDVYQTSATGIYYALEMQAELDVPVGFVVAAVGGTGLTSWVSPEVAEAYTDYYTLIRAKGYDQTSADAKDYLGGWYNSRVAPWQGYEAAGMIWYQGEHERNGNSAIQTLGIEVLVESWSKVFDFEGTATATELPLIAIQIAPYATASSDSELVNNYTLNGAMREGVAKVVAKGGTAQIVSQYDLYVTVNDIHPKNKPELCARVADTALGLVYGKQAVYSGPVVKEVTYTDGLVSVTFDNVGQGLKYVQLNETDNYRILNADHILNTADFYVDKLNGFTVWTGSKLLEVDAVITGKDQVQITLPAGTAVAGLYYGYGAEILSANLFNAEGFPAVPFYDENESYVPAAQYKLIWNAENAALTAGYDLSALASTNNDKVSAVISAGTGVSGSKALAYTKTTNSNTQSSNFTLKSAAPGFNGVQIDAGDVLWFWVDSDLTGDRLLHVQLNNSHLGMHSIYTIVSEDGAPVISELAYDASGKTEGDGLALIASAGNAAANATYARIRLDTDWSGWLGIPVANFDGNGSTVPTGAVENVIFRLAGGRGEVGEPVYFDEFWLTSAGVMPDLEDSALLYKEAAESVEPEKMQTLIWDQERNTKEVNVKSTYNDTAKQQRNNSQTTVADGFGLNGSKALKYEALEAGSLQSTNSTTGIKRCITHTLSNFTWAGYGAADPTVQASDDIFWLWVNADLSTTQRFTFQLQGYDIKVQSGETYVYTIVSNNGVAEMVKILYSADPNAPVDSVAGIDLVNENPSTNAAANAQIRLAKDFSGWIGIPLNMLKTAINPGTKLTKFSLLLNQYSCEDPLENQQVGDAVYMDEFWLTAADTMPKLSNDSLLYKADAAATAAQRGIAGIAALPAQKEELLTYISSEE